MSNESLMCSRHRVVPAWVQSSSVSMPSVNISNFHYTFCFSLYILFLIIYCFSHSCRACVGSIIHASGVSMPNVNTGSSGMPAK